MVVAVAVDLSSHESLCILPPPNKTDLSLVFDQCIEVVYEVFEERKKATKKDKKDKKDCIIS